MKYRLQKINKKYQLFWHTGSRSISGFIFDTAQMAIDWFYTEHPGETLEVEIAA